MSGAIPEGKLHLAKALLAGGVMTRETVERELERSGKGSTRMGKALLACGFPSEDDLVAVIAKNIRIPNVRLQNLKAAPDVVSLIPRDLAEKFQVIAIEKIGDILVCVTTDIGNMEAFAAVRRETGCFMAPIRCAEDGFSDSLQRFYSGSAAAPSGRQTAGSDRATADTSSGASSRRTTADSGSAPAAADPDALAPIECGADELSGAVALPAGNAYFNLA